MATDLLMISRRGLLAALAASAALLPAGAAWALSANEARALVGRVMDEIMSIINSGQPESVMLAQFEQVFVRYADVAIIARSALGPPARTATPSQMRAFTEAFQGYMARKYGRRFRELIGGRVQVTGARQVQTFYEVISTVTLAGRAPFEVRWHVSDRGGRNLFFNMIIEGVNMLTAERQEIGAMLDARRGDLDLLVADLRRLG
jgi:phospholipid transport system substrate-binding protein